MDPVIQRHGQDYSHITRDQWADMGSDFEKAQADILKKVERGEYSPEFGQSLGQTMQQKYDGHLNREAHCGPCTPLKVEAMRLVSDVNYRHPGTIDDDTLCSIFEQADAGQLDGFIGALRQAASVVAGNPDLAKDAEKLEHLLVALGDVGQRIESGDIEVVDEVQAAADGMSRHARISPRMVEDILGGIKSGEIRGGPHFRATLKENEVSEEEFFRGLFFFLREKPNQQKKWLSHFEDWGYEPEVAWVRRALEPMGGRPADKAQEPERRAPDAPQAAEPAEPPTPRPLPAAAPTPPVPAPSEPTLSKQELREKLTELKRQPFGQSWHRWKIVVRNKQTGEKMMTERTLSPKGVEMHLRQLQDHPALDLVNFEDLGVAERLAAEVVGLEVYAQDEAGGDDRFKAGTPIIFVEDVELQFDALNARGVIKKNMTGKIKKVLDEGYLVDIAGQQYVVPLNAGPHVMDVFVGEVVGGGPDEVGMEEVPAAETGAAPEPEAAPQQPAVAAPPAEIPPNALQPAGSVIGRVVVADGEVTEKPARRRQPIIPKAGRRYLSKGYEHFRRLQQRALAERGVRPAGKATFDDLRQEVEQQDADQKPADEANLQDDMARLKHPPRAASLGTEAFNMLLDQIERDAPGVPAEIGRRLYRGLAAKDGRISPVGGDKT